MSGKSSFAPVEKVKIVERFLREEICVWKQRDPSVLIQLRFKDGKTSITKIWR